MTRRNAVAEQQIEALAARIRECRICIDEPRGRPLAHEPRPVVFETDLLPALRREVRLRM